MARNCTISDIFIIFIYQSEIIIKNKIMFIVDKKKK